MLASKNFQTYFSYFTGMSNSGKTSYIKLLLEQSDKAFSETPSRVIYFYNVYQSKFSEMEASIPNISFFQGLPQRCDIEKFAEAEKHLLLVFDDLYYEVISSKDLSDLTIMLCHHLNISCIFTSHNIFTSGKFSKTIATNLHYILLFTLRNRLQLITLATQLFCHKNKSKSFVSVYDRVIDETPFSPLVIDLSPRCPNHRYMLRKNVLPGQYPIIYELQ